MRPRLHSWRAASLRGETPSAAPDSTIETEAGIYMAALRERAKDQRHVINQACAQAESLLDQIADTGRYRNGETTSDREADCLRLALALVRWRRAGFEDGVVVHAWWRDSLEQSRNGKQGVREGGARMSRTPRNRMGEERLR